MKERPILFSGPMVRAILEGHKTQTRRIVKPQWPADVEEVSELPALDPTMKWMVSGHSGEWSDDHGLDEDRRCPYGKPGDRLWVKETFWRNTTFAGERIRYRADDLVRHIAEKDLPRGPNGEDVGIEDGNCWKPSIFMPRWASRITLEVTAVRVERLQDISEEDAKAEGAPLDFDPDNCPPNRRHIESYFMLWESINGEDSWHANPWVWVIEFRRVTP